MSTAKTPTWTTRNPRAFLCDTCGQPRSKHSRHAICPIATDYLVELIAPEDGTIVDYHWVAATSADAAREITAQANETNSLEIGRALPDSRIAL